MNFNQILKYLLDEELELTTEGRHSEVTKKGLTNNLKLNPEFADLDRFVQTFKSSIDKYFKTANAGIFAKYGPMGNGTKDYDMSEVLGKIYQKILNDSESVGYVVNTRDFTKTSGQTTQEKNFIVKEGPIGKATFEVADELGISYQKNVNKQRGMVGTIKNVLFDINGEGESFLMKNTDKAEEDVVIPDGEEGSTPKAKTTDITKKFFEVTKSIRHPLTKKSIEKDLGEDAYAALKIGTFSFVAVGSKATSDELLAEIRDAFRDEAINIKPMLALDALIRAGVIEATDSLDSPEKTEDDSQYKDDKYAVGSVKDSGAPVARGIGSEYRGGGYIAPKVRSFDPDNMGFGGGGFE